MKIQAKQIDALLPQTQCGQCGYEGCFPYAQAMAEKGETIDRCPPGGLKTLKALAKLLGKSAQPFLEKIAAEEKPSKIAYIRESECIGCTKCIQACPVDAILGAAKQLHTVLQQECTGCGLCVPPCPVDCIDMLSLNLPSYHPERARKRFQAKKQRLEKEIIEKKQMEETQKITTRLAYVTVAVARAKAKKKPSFQIFSKTKINNPPTT